jgi:hypothetical protein
MVSMWMRDSLEDAVVGARVEVGLPRPPPKAESACVRTVAERSRGRGRWGKT